ncbi:MAG: sensor histidine kinase [Saprospiraceae bacterium]|nr:sensor histidine kinase [Saprospiraceae bacterium]
MVSGRITHLSRHSWWTGLRTGMLFACMWMGLHTLRAQITMDSIQAIVTAPIPDTTKVLKLTKIGERLRYADPSLSDSSSVRALALARKMHFIKGVAFSMVNLSATNLIRGNYSEVEQYTEKLLDLAIEENLPKIQLDALGQQAIKLYHQGRYHDALQVHFVRLSILDTFPILVSELITYNNIGINYERLEEPEKALEYYQKAYDLGVEVDNKYYLAAIGANMGVIHKTLGNLAKAKELFINSIEAAHEVNNPNLLVDETSNLAEVYMLEESYLDAHRYNRESYTLARQIGDPNGMMKAQMQQGNIFYEEGKYDAAQASLEDSRRIADTLGDNEERLNLYELFHKNFAAQGRMDRAYQSALLYAAYRDSIFNLEKTNEVAALETKFQTAEKEKEIAEQAIELEKKTHQRNRLFATVLFIGLLGLSIFTVLMLRLRENRKLAKQNEIIQQQMIASLEKEKKIMSMASMIDGQESERIRIAKDLHDGLGGLLNGVRTQMGRIEKEITKLTDLDLYAQTNKMMAEASAEVRRISQNLMPSVLRLEGLQGAIEDLCHQLESVHGLEVDLHLQLSGLTLDETQETFLYRIVQELTNNIVKHAQANEVMVQAISYEDHLNLIIEDNGVGFDTSILEGKSGIGVRSVQSRVDFLSGSLDLSSTPDLGTSISINIPLNPKK